MITLEAVLVKVCPGCVIVRHGRSWVAGQRVHLMPDDARRLADHGTVEIVR